MARINLLPWREWERERRRKEFLTNLVASGLAGVLIVFLAGLYLDGRIDRQSERNEWLNDEIAELDSKIAEIRDLHREREQLLERMSVIEDLQRNRPVIVRVFDELVRSNPRGTFLRNLQMEGDRLSVEGTAESNNRISTLMRNLESSDWFNEPNLRRIREHTDYGPQASNFQLTVRQTDPDEDAADGGG